MPDHRPHPKLTWHTENVTRQPIFVVPGDAAGSGPVKPMGKTWGMRVSGDVDKLVEHEYCCPVHGRFVARIPVSNVPDEVACTIVTGEQCLTSLPPQYVKECCGLTSPWSGASVAIGIEPGMVTG